MLNNILEKLRKPKSEIFSKLDFKKAYNHHVQKMVGENSDYDHAMSQAVGGNFHGIGQLTANLVKQHGLKEGQTIIDMGCGSGRLAFALREFDCKLIGYDVVEELVLYAEKKVARTDWKFSTSDGYRIPEPDNSADYITFFSVFTHLLHEHCYMYLQDCKRVLKPGGKVIFSFLEYSVAGNWEIFEHMLATVDSMTHHNQFMGRDAIEAWSKRLGFEIEGVYKGDEAHIDLPDPITFENGNTIEGKGCLGQSVAVLRFV